MSRLSLAQAQEILKENGYEVRTETGVYKYSISNGTEGQFFVTGRELVKFVREESFTKATEITNSVLNKILTEVIEEAKKAGLNLKEIFPYIEQVNATSFYGRCFTNAPCKIQLSRQFVASGDLKKIRGTIAHEVCHAVIGASGHGKVWKSAANVMNTLYGYNISRVGTAESYHNNGQESPLSLAKKANAKYHITCECGACNDYRNRASNITKYPSRYRCRRCNSKITVEEL